MKANHEFDIPLARLLKHFLIVLGSLWLPFSSGVFAGQPAMPEGVRVAQTDELGPVFVNDQGFTLYTSRYDDKPNQSVCNDKSHDAVVGQGQNPGYLPDYQTRPTCEQAWPPFRPQDGSKAAGTWTIIDRHDGSRQWAYQGKPVYLSSYDQNPGDLTTLGGGIFGRSPVFASIDVPPGISSRITASGFVLTDDNGKTLYARSQEADPCGIDCEEDWQPLAAPAVVTDEVLPSGWSVKDRSDGRHQWLKDGKPLYTYKQDLKPGDVKGGVPGWGAIVLFPPLEPPSDIGMGMTMDGEVFTDRKGMTLYTWHCTDESPDFLPCDRPGASPAYWKGICGSPEVCISTWQPVEVTPGSRPVGNTWTIIPVDPRGHNQFAPADENVKPMMVWAYHGKPVYTYAGDEKPGDIWGHGVRSFVRWGFSMLKTDLSDRAR